MPTLLLADDSLTIQRVIDLTFAGEGVNVVAVSDGDAAIALVEREPPDIVLADVGMPGKSGYEVSRYIKSSPRLAHIPVLLLTGAFEPVDEQQAAEARCDGVLTKPFEPGVVITRVRELLEGARTAVDAAARTEAGPAVVAAAGVGLESTPPAAHVPASTAAESSEGGVPTGAGAAHDAADFFEQLDARFAVLPPAGVGGAAFAAPDLEGGSPAPASASLPAQGLGASLERALPETLETWAADQAGTEAATPAPPAAATPAPAAASEGGPARVTPAYGPSRSAPGLADAFLALLAAEEQGGAPPLPAPWALPPVVVDDDLVDRVARRVLERLSDQVVRDATTEVVSRVAERLVRDEIDRIKAAIR